MLFFYILLAFSRTRYTFISIRDVLETTYGRRNNCDENGHVGIVLVIDDILVWDGKV